MKNKLQYAYSITVFMGVLVTAYLMMNREGNAHIPMRALPGPSNLRTEAFVLDPGVNQLFEMEDALSKLPRNSEPAMQKRAPSDTKKLIDSRSTSAPLSRKPYFRLGQPSSGTEISVSPRCRFMLTNRGMTAIFLSDVHLRDSGSVKARLVIRFLQEVASRFEHIFILGDLLMSGPGLTLISCDRFDR